jgi:hypothetical protein
VAVNIDDSDETTSWPPRSARKTKTPQSGAFVERETELNHLIATAENVNDDAGLDRKWLRWFGFRLPFGSVEFREEVRGGAELQHTSST